jgi:glycosyltransferase involved in cell wall biosynthesis
MSGKEAERRHHVLYVIDQLQKPFGGAERVLLKMLENLPSTYRGTVLTFKTNLTTEEIARMGAPLIVFPMTSAYDLNAAKMALRLRKLVRQESVEIVHTFFESSDLWAGTIAKLVCRVAVVSSRRDMGILRGRKHKVLYRALSNVPDKVIAVSEQVKQFVIATDRTPAKKVVTIYNGLEVADSGHLREEFRRRLAVAADERLVTTVGNIRRVKGFDVLLEAAERICAGNSRVRFVVVGGVAEKDCAEELKQAIGRKGLGEKFLLAGESAEVAGYLSASDVFVLPSRNEGFSNALIEAMASGLPSVATAVGGNGEAVEDGGTG